MGNIIIYGGTFNPIHTGHMHFVKSALEVTGADKAMLVPSGQPRHKTCFSLASPRDRLEMCRLATEGMANIEVSDYEARKAGFSKTAHTIEHFRRLYPQDELYFLVGCDNFLYIDRWYGAEDILSKVALCAAVRKDGSAERVMDKCDMYNKKGYRAQVLDIDTIDMSSTRVRDAILEGHDTSHMIPAAVKDYIMKNGLYGQDKSNYKSLSA